VRVVPVPTWMLKLGNILVALYGLQDEPAYSMCKVQIFCAEHQHALNHPCAIKFPYPLTEL